MRDDAEDPVPKPPGDLWILMLGHSLTYGNGVGQHDTCAEVLERRLRERGPPVRSLNTGVQGYSTYQEEVYVGECRLGFDPDLFFVGFFTAEVSPMPSDGFNVGQTDARGRFQFTGLRGLFSSELVYRLKRLRILSFIAHAVSELRWRYFPPPDEFWVAAIYRNVETPLSRRSWAGVGASLRRIRDVEATGGIETIVLALPLAGQVEPAASTAGYHDHLYAIAHELGLATVDPLKAMRAASRAGTHAFLEYDGYPSAAGHRVVAEERSAPGAAALERHLAALRAADASVVP